MTTSEPETSAFDLIREAGELRLAAARRTADAAAGRPWTAERDRAFFERSVEHAERMQAAAPGTVDLRAVDVMRAELARLYGS